METIAIYWEPKIKTYGLQELTDLCLLELDFKPEIMSDWGLEIQAMADLGIQFELVLLQYAKEASFRLYLLVKRVWEEPIATFINRGSRMKDGVKFGITSPVELIYFYGPHFGDRYGIADAAFKTLINKTVPAIVSVCSGSVIYLVLQEGMAREARISLSEVFEVPRHAQ
jgi:hypothetical protein